MSAIRYVIISYNDRVRFFPTDASLSNIVLGLTQNGFVKPLTLKPLSVKGK